jgi:ABC-type nitrate/sulfonate/bicarbonate transport system ATPase subunit
MVKQRGFALQPLVLDSESVTISHNLEEALLLSDKIVMNKHTPAAGIDKILAVKASSI